MVTLVRNSGKYIEQTIRSVLAQCYPNLEYFIVDGGSTDGTIEIIRKYEKELSGWISEPDRGMYDALNKGFAQASGEIMGWISATDMLHVGGLRVVGSVFQSLPSVEWITGRPTGFNEEGLTVQVQPVPRWSRYRFLAGANRYIQQESTFWRRSLWEKAGSRMDDSRRNANDFELWVRFFRHAQLYPVDALIGGFRIHADSLALMNLEFCHRVHDEIINKELESIPRGNWIRAFRKIDKSIMKIRGLRYAWWKIVIPSLYGLRGPDFPPVIQYDWNHGWIMRP
ncbi:MAG: glycosyltransferase family 2 protein [Candidatus Acidiferrales bacterium]